MEAVVAKVVDVRKHPDADRLTIVTVLAGDQTHEVVANLREDGTPRWEAGEVCVYVPENAIIPEDVLKERGYWDETKNKGMLGGSKGNRVKMTRFVGFESRGLLFKYDRSKFVDLETLEPLYQFNNGHYFVHAKMGQDLTEFFGITEYVPA